MRYRLLIAAALLTTVLVASGCGSTSTSASKPLTRSELVAKVEPICARINTKISYYSNLTPSNSKDLVSKSAIASAAPQISSVERNAVAEMEKLTPPSALANDWKQIVDGVKTVSEDTMKVGEDVKIENRTLAASVMASAETALQQMRAAAARDGLAQCEKVI
ncbi:MAG TPA: hypothetical protein VIJ39_10260 [Solirubrobacteraceae bacterium]